MTQSHPASLDDPALLAQCQTIRGRASGPGGQHRNKVETAIRLRHKPTGIEGAASERREAARNLAVALFRLRVNLSLHVRMDAPRLPSALWESRSKGGRIAINPAHPDFPAMLAEALDHLEACGNDPVRAASRLGCTTSQLIKLLKDEPRALARVNAQRMTRHEHPLK
ncbi:MAG: peptide chain release factor-like protein [Phycisphaeraceae bacterium]|nr:peptide chain release factor-like protein [Phycisphaeraceae bacterium]